MTDAVNNDPPSTQDAAEATSPSETTPVVPPSDARRLQRVLLILVVLGCVGVTLLLILNVMENRRGVANKDFHGKSMTPTLFDQPLDMKPFTLTDQTGAPFNSADLNGKVWVANFFFSTCPTMCPRILAHTRELQKELNKRLGPGSAQVKIISISVDPEKDTPAKLRETAELWEADLDMWRFLTGTREEVWGVINQSFHTGVTANPKNKAEPIIHSPNYVLVDRQGRIRGFYDGLNPEKRSELLRDLLRLVGPKE